MLNIYIHPSSDVKAKVIGVGTNIWQFCVVFEGAKIGKNCNICAHVLIEGDVLIGDNVTVKSGVQLWNGITIEDDVFIGPNVTFTNDISPRSKIYPKDFLKTVVKKGASIGANATILPGLEIGAGAMIGAGAVVTKSVPSNAKIMGNPGKIIGYIDSATNLNTSIVKSSIDSISHGTQKFNRLGEQTLPVYSDIRGSLTVGNFEDEIPFIPRRYFMVFGVPTSQTRGQHAHWKCQQYLICINGSCNVLLNDGGSQKVINLTSLNIGLYIPPMIWAEQYDFSPDAILLVFASHLYEASDYIREYSEYFKIVKEMSSE